MTSLPNTLDREVSIFSNHAARRAARRNLMPDVVEHVLAHSRCIQRTGVIFYFLGRRDLPPADRQASWAARLEGTVVLRSHDGESITVYRHRKALPAIRRKLKYRRDYPGSQTIENGGSSEQRPEIDIPASWPNYCRNEASNRLSRQ